MASSLLSGGTCCTRLALLNSSRTASAGGRSRQVRSTTTTATHRSPTAIIQSNRLSFPRTERALISGQHGLACTNDLTTLMSSLSCMPQSTLVSSSVGGGSLSYKEKVGRVASSAGFSSLSAAHAGGAVRASHTASSENDYYNWELYCAASALLAAGGALFLSSSVTYASPASPAHLESPLAHPSHFHIGVRGGGKGGGGGGSGGPGGGKPGPYDGLVKPNESGLGGKKTSSRSKTIPQSYDVSVRALKGQRQYMEDEYFVGNGGRFAAIFDGHGGGGVSAYLRDHLPGMIDEQLKVKHWEETDEVVSGDSSKIRASISSRVGAIRSAFEKVDQDVLSNKKLRNVGSTAVVVVVHEGEDGHRTLLSANVGDSRAILSRRGRAVDLTRDHKPNDEREKTRILAMGETIEWDYYSKVHRIRNLSLSRSIGDGFAKPAVSGEVEIKHFPVAEDGDEFFLLASDGLWDVMTSQQVVDFVHERLSESAPPGASEDEDMGRLKYTRRKNMARFVANEAIRRGSADNVCVVLVWLNDMDFSPTYE